MIHILEGSSTSVYRTIIERIIWFQQSCIDLNGTTIYISFSLSHSLSLSSIYIYITFVAIPKLCGNSCGGVCEPCKRPLELQQVLKSVHCTDARTLVTHKMQTFRNGNKRGITNRRMM